MSHNSPVVTPKIEREIKESATSKGGPRFLLRQSMRTYPQHWSWSKKCTNVTLFLVFLTQKTFSKSCVSFFSCDNDFTFHSQFSLIIQPLWPKLYMSPLSNFPLSGLTPIPFRGWQAWAISSTTKINISSSALSQFSLNKMSANKKVITLVAVTRTNLDVSCFHQYFIGMKF